MFLPFAINDAHHIEKKKLFNIEMINTIHR